MVIDAQRFFEIIDQCSNEADIISLGRVLSAVIPKLICAFRIDDDEAFAVREIAHSRIAHHVLGPRAAAMKDQEKWQRFSLFVRSRHVQQVGADRSSDLDFFGGMIRGLGISALLNSFSDSTQSTLGASDWLDQRNQGTE